MNYKNVLTKAVVIVVYTILLAYQARGQLYNTTGVEEANNIYEQIVALNIILDGVIGYALLLIVCVPTFIIASARSGTLAGLSIMGWIGVLSSTILVSIDLVAWHIYQGMLVFFGISLLFAILLRRFSSEF